jgi:hypothetical protein
MSLWHPDKIALSRLKIDTSKDWLGYLIKNLGVPVDVGDALRKGTRLTMTEMPDGTLGYVLTGQGLGANPAYQAPITPDAPYVSGYRLIVAYLKRVSYVGTGGTTTEQECARAVVTLKAGTYRVIFKGTEKHDSYDGKSVTARFYVAGVVRSSFTSTAPTSGTAPFYYSFNQESDTFTLAGGDTELKVTVKQDVATTYGKWLGDWDAILQREA